MRNPIKTRGDCLKWLEKERWSQWAVQTSRIESIRREELTRIKEATGVTVCMITWLNQVWSRELPLTPGTLISWKEELVAVLTELLFTIVMRTWNWRSRMRERITIVQAEEECLSKARKSKSSSWTSKLSNNSKTMRKERRNKSKAPMRTMTSFPPSLESLLKKT